MVILCQDMGTLGGYPYVSSCVFCAPYLQGWLHSHSIVLFFATLNMIMSHSCVLCCLVVVVAFCFVCLWAVLAPLCVESIREESMWSSLPANGGLVGLVVPPCLGKVFLVWPLARVPSPCASPTRLGFSLHSYLFKPTLLARVCFWRAAKFLLGLSACLLQIGRAHV